MARDVDLGKPPDPWGVYTDAALSGTPVILKIVVSGTPYYWKVYPTKA